MRSISNAAGLALLSGVLLLVGCSNESPENLMASARKYIDKKDVRAAGIQLKNLLQKNPENAEARFLLGKLLLESGDVVGAGVELQKAQELGYDPDPLIPLLARIALAKGQPQKVVDSYGQQVLKAPEAKADLQVVLAWAYLGLNKRAEAQAATSAALAAVPGHVGARLLQIRMMAGGKDVAGAIAELDKVIASAPANAEARQLKGELLLLSGQDDAALAAFREAIEREHANASAHTAALWVLLAKKDLAGAEKQLEVLRKAAPQAPQTKFFTASVAFEKGDLKTATEQAQRLLQQTPDDVMALQLAGSIELSKGSLLQAEAHLAKALQLSPAQPRIRLLLVQTHLRAGDTGKAIKVLQPLLDSNPPQWEAQVLMAQAQLMTGDSAMAEQYYERAAALNPKDSRSRTALALAQVAKGQTEKGLEALRSISAADTGVVADLALINAHLRRKEFDNALGAIARLESKQPKSPLAADLRGRVELQRGRSDQARAAFQAALAIDPFFFPATTALASMEVADGKQALAQQRFENFVKARPADFRGGMALARLRAQAGASHDELLQILNRTVKAAPTEVAPRMALIGLYLERKDFKSGLASAQEGLNEQPDNPELLDALGQAQFYAGDLNQAMATYNRAITLQPGAIAPLMRLAELYRYRKDFPAASATLRKVVELKPDFVPARQALMVVDLMAGRPKQALDMARAVQRQPGNEAIGFALEGDLESSRKNWPAAVSAYRESLNKRASVDIAIKLHRVLLQAGQNDAAAKLEQQWTANPSSAPTFIYYLADAALSKGQHDLARQQYAAVLKLRPDSAAALNNLAWLLGRDKKPEALDLALKAVKLAPSEPAYMDTLAEIYAGSGDFDKAVQTQVAAVAAAPDVPAYRLHLASYYLSANDKTKAKAELDRLTALGDKFKGQAEVEALRARL